MGGRPQTLDQFVEKARRTHGDKYDYDAVKYVKSTIKVVIRCLTHGKFFQTPASHIQGHGCSRCGLEKIRKKPNALTTESFLEIARSIHGDKFGYDLVEYVRSTNKVRIVCKDHGPFDQIAGQHLQGHGCRKCADEENGRRQQKTHDQFIRDAIAVHGDYYNYDQVEYLDSLVPVKIVCPIHGSFAQLPPVHLRGSGCRECGIHQQHRKQQISTEEILRRCKEAHGDKYSYLKLDQLLGVDRKLEIICPEHGKFYQRALNHFNGHGCRACGGNQPLTTEEFISRCLEVHGDIYDFSKVEYVNQSTKVTVICPHHGPWKVKPNNLLYNKRGCGKCRRTYGERRIARLLKEAGISFKIEWKDHDCIINVRPGKFDFYVPKHKTLIEFDGPQHFRPTKTHQIKNAKEGYLRTKHSDDKKNAWAKKNGYRMIRIRYDEDIDEAMAKLIKRWAAEKR